MWTLLGAYFLVAVTVVVLRALVLPNVHQYSARIADALEKAIGQHVTLGSVTADWTGFHPRLSIVDFRLYDARGDLALELPRIAATISWRSLVTA